MTFKILNLLLLSWLFHLKLTMNIDWQHSPLTAMLALQSCSVTVAIATGVSTAADLSALGLVTMVMFCGGRWALFKPRKAAAALKAPGLTQVQVWLLNWFHQRTDVRANLNSGKQQTEYILQSIFMLQWNELHRASCCSSTSDLRNLKANCVITSTWAEAGRPLLVTTWTYKMQDKKNLLGWLKEKENCCCKRKTKSGKMRPGVVQPNKHTAVQTQLSSGLNNTDTSSVLRMRQSLLHANTVFLTNDIKCAKTETAVFC